MTMVLLHDGSLKAVYDVKVSDKLISTVSRIVYEDIKKLESGRNIIKLQSQ